MVDQIRKWYQVANPLGPFQGEGCVDSQTSNREGQTIDLALELLTHISVLIHEPSQA